MEVDGRVPPWRVRCRGCQLVAPVKDRYAAETLARKHLVSCAAKPPGKMPKQTKRAGAVKNMKVKKSKTSGNVSRTER